MSDLVTIALVVAVVAYVIGRQLLGEPLRRKRVVILPLVLTVVGAVDVHDAKDLGTADVVCLAVGAVLVAAIGVAQGARMRLSAHDGYLWGQMPVSSLWLWGALVGSRLVMMVVAHGVDAEVAASTSTIILTLGVNRLAQAAVVMPRALSAGIPFAPESGDEHAAARLAPRADHVVTHTDAADTATDWQLVGRRAAAFVSDRRGR